ncbi:hypothetical protein QAD02_000257 [Eretmocerus hayati]|uniref:Uncharacterized protein n=1 Tax=Eretmocerus hayati TaxID=131215 RepID=A0ACC2NDH2_9HYME|nr:hypothetical protein QAD02_000257 [Eretmocerus hayati]
MVMAAADFDKLQTIGEDFCGLDVNTPLGGREPMTAVPVLTFDETLLTAVAATSTSDYTVVFLGTSEGHLKKFSISRNLKIPIKNYILAVLRTAWIHKVSDPN